MSSNRNPSFNNHEGEDGVMPVVKPVSGKAQLSMFKKSMPSAIFIMDQKGPHWKHGGGNIAMGDTEILTHLFL